MSGPDTDTLALEAKTDPEALRVLLDACDPLLKSIIRKHASKRVQALHWEDAYQVCRIAVGKAVEKFDPARGSFATLCYWEALPALKAMANSHANTCYMPREIKDMENCPYVRRAMAEPVDASESWDLASDDPSPADLAEGSDTLSALRAAMSNLTEKQRAAVERFLSVGGTQREKANKAGRTHQAESFLLKTAFAALRRMASVKALREP